MANTLAAAAVEWLKGASPVADLFAGLGTFAFALAKAGAKVLAAEADRAAHLACKAGRRSGLVVHPLHRDLFRNPLLPEELNRFAGVVLDPPRAGAREQGRRRPARCGAWSISAATLQAGRAMRRRWWQAAIGWPNCARWGSSAGPRM
jgi:tRNA/tmRNA/rRNA uracil-C5-methylase (TrmA/RlmC/RlmD family)